MQGMIKDEGSGEWPQFDDDEVIEGSAQEFEEHEEASYLKIRDKLDLKKLKKYMMSTVGSPFCTNVLRIALNKKEGTIASTLVAKYCV